MAKRYTISVLVEAKDKVSGIFDKITTGAMERLGHKVTDLIQQLPRMAIEMVQLGATAEAAENRFVKFAGGADEAAALLEAFQDAADGTVPRLDAMSSAARLLQMGLVKDADQMELVTAIAVRLGNQTMSAGDRISDFAMLLANQSIPRLDNFGISSGRVRARIKELQASIDDLSREEAFKIAVMEEGTTALETLGDTSELAQTKIDKLKAAVEDAKVSVGEFAAEAVTASGDVDSLAESIRTAPERLFATVGQLGTLAGGVDDVVEAFFRLDEAWDPLEAFNRGVADAYYHTDKFINDLPTGAGYLDSWQRSMIDASVTTEQFTETSEQLSTTWLGIQSIWGMAGENFAFFHEQWALFAEAAGVELPQQRTGWEMLGASIGEVRTAITETGPEYIIQVEEAARETERLALEAQNAAAVTGDIFVAALGDATDETDFMAMALFQAADAAGADADTLFDLADTLGLYTDTELEAAIATVALRTALDRLGEAVALGAMTMEDAMTALQDLMVSMPKAVDLMKRQSQVTHHVKSNYQAMAKAEREAAEAARELARAMAHTGDVFVDFLPTAADDTDAWAMALFNAADAAGASAEQLALLGGALGIYSEEQVEAALASAALQVKIEELGAAIAAQTMGYEQAIEQLMRFKEQFLPMIAPVTEGAGAAGGSVTNNNFSMTVNTGAGSSSVIQDYETLQALANV